MESVVCRLTESTNHDSFCRFCLTWVVQEKQRKERLKINHCWKGYIYQSPCSSVTMSFAHSIKALLLDLESKLQFEKCKALLHVQTSESFCTKKTFEECLTKISTVSLHCKDTFIVGLFLCHLKYVNNRYSSLEKDKYSPHTI